MKKYIILIIVVLSYVILTLTVNLINNINTSYIVFSDGKNLLYKNGEWSIINNEQIANGKYNFVKDGTYYTKSKIEQKNEFLTINNDEQLTNFMIGYKGKKIKNIEYKIMYLDSNDYKYLESIILKQGLNVRTKDISYMRKYIIDLNNDQVSETIYVISNNWDIQVGDLFSMIIVKEHNQVIQYDKFDNEYDSYIPTLYFLNNQNDKTIEMIIKNTYSSLIGQSTKIISFSSLQNYDIIYETEVK